MSRTLHSIILVASATCVQASPSLLFIVDVGASARQGLASPYWYASDYYLSEPTTGGSWGARIDEEYGPVHSKATILAFLSNRTLNVTLDGFHRTAGWGALALDWLNYHSMVRVFAPAGHRIRADVSPSNTGHLDVRNTLGSYSHEEIVLPTYHTPDPIVWEDGQEYYEAFEFKTLSRGFWGGEHVYNLTHGGVFAPTLSASITARFTNLTLPPPVAIISEPNNGKKLLPSPLRTYAFKSNSYDPDDGTAAGSGITEHRWTFERLDQRSAVITKSGPTVEHGFAKDGRYKVTLEVTDNEGDRSKVERYHRVEGPKPYIAGTLYEPRDGNYYFWRGPSLPFRYYLRSTSRDHSHLRYMNFSEFVYEPTPHPLPYPWSPNAPAYIRGFTLQTGSTGQNGEPYLSDIHFMFQFIRSPLGFVVGQPASASRRQFYFYDAPWLPDRTNNNAYDPITFNSLKSRVVRGSNFTVYREIRFDAVRNRWMGVIRKHEQEITFPTDLRLQ